MQKMHWLESHVGTLEDGIQIINKFHWFLTVVEGKSGKQWFVKSGEEVIFSTDSKSAIDAFLYGMSLAYAGIPDPLFDRLVEETKHWIE
jgi:hypothetical protein